VYPDYLFFPGGYTAAAGAAAAISPADTAAPSSNRYVFRVALLVLRIVSWPGFAKEHSANFDNHSELEIPPFQIPVHPSAPHIDLVPNFQDWLDRVTPKEVEPSA
jgi:hypothetical protein